MLFVYFSSQYYYYRLRTEGRAVVLSLSRYYNVLDQRNRNLEKDFFVNRCYLATSEK